MKKFTFLTVTMTVALLFAFQSIVHGQYSGTGTFTKISAMADLTDGYYVIAYGTTFAMNNTNAGSYFANTAITPSSNNITNPATTIVWKIQTHADGGRTIYNEASAKYVSYTGSSNAAYAVASVTGGSERWTFAWSSTVFTITNVTSTTRLLQYNTGSPRFACYTGSQQNITLYKLAGPTINVTGSFNPFSTPVGTPSASQSVAVSGANLTGNIDVAALSGFEYSTNNSDPWASTLSLATSFNGNVYARLTGTSIGSYSGNISFSSTGATQVDKAVTGIVNPLTPVINATGSFTAFTTTVGTPSTSQAIAISGSNLTAGIEVSAVSGYEYSTTDAAPWASTLSLASSFSGNVYVRLTGASLGSPSGIISFTSSGATQVDKTVTGTVTVPPPVITVTGTFTSFTTSVGTPSASQSVAVAGSNMTAGIEMSAVSGFEYSTTNSAPWTSTLSLSSSFNGNVYVRLTGGSIGSSSGTISFTSTGATSVTKAVSGIVTCAAASFPFVENFDYPATSLLTANCWNNHSGTSNFIPVAASSISYSGYLSSGIGNEVSLLPTGEDVNRTFTAQTSGSIYASFLVNVSASQTTGDYFFHIGSTPLSSNIFEGRVYIKKDASTTNFAFGLNKSSTAGTLAYSGFNYTPGTTYLVVLKYTFNTGSTTDDVVSLYVNPTLHIAEPTPLLSVTDASVADLTSLDFVALRQGSAGNAPTLKLDGIRISNSWADIVGTIIPASSTYTGTGDWDNVANWSNGLPGAITNVTINGNLTVNQTVECNNFTISPVGTVTVSNGQGLIVDGNLLIQSSIAGTGSFIANAADYLISGTTSVERFLTKYDAQGDDMFHFLSSPVAAQAIAPNFQSIASTNSDFYSWDEVTNMWINSLINNPTEWNPAFESNFTVGKGYLVAYPADLTKTFIGALNTGNIATSLTYTPAQGNGWNLLGNPYPSAIDWDNVSGTNLDNAVYVYDNASATYKSYVAGVGTLTDGIIPSTQGFFVHANAASPSLTLENQDRVHAATAFYKNDAIQNLVRLMVSGNNKTDETIIRFADNATTAFDSQMDAYKLSGGASVPTFYSLAGNTKLSVNSLPSTSMEDYVALAVEAGAASTYEISLAENTLSSEVYVTLEDTKTGVSQKLNDNPVYSFTAAPGEDPIRFRLHFKDAASVANPVLAGINAYSVDGQIRITSDKNLNGLVTLTDMAGRLIAKTNMTQATSCMLNVHGLTGIYVVNIATTEGNFVQKVAVK